MRRKFGWIRIPTYTGVQMPMKLSMELREIVSVPVASRAQLAKLIWRYAKEKKLQWSEDRRYIVPDERMRKVFGSEKFIGFQLGRFLKPHLTPIPKIKHPDDIPRHKMYK